MIIGIGQSYVLITGNIDLSIGSVVGMSAMIAATLMTMGVNPVVAILITFVCCMIIGVLNGILVGKGSSHSSDRKNSFQRTLLFHNDIFTFLMVII